MSDPLASIADALGAIGPIVASSVGIAAGIYAFLKNVGRIRRLFGTTDQTRLIMELRQLAEVRLEMYETVTAALADERQAHAQARDERDFAQRSADQCERRLNALLDERAPEVK